MPFFYTATCAATSGDAAVGSMCNLTTTADTVIPSGGGFIKEMDRMNVEVGQILVNDGGSDGLATTSPNTVFERQGIYIP